MELSTPTKITLIVALILVIGGSIILTKPKEKPKDFGTVIVNYSDPNVWFAPNETYELPPGTNDTVRAEYYAGRPIYNITLGNNTYLSTPGEPFKIDETKLTPEQKQQIKEFTEKINKEIENKITTLHQTNIAQGKPKDTLPEINDTPSYGGELVFVGAVGGNDPAILEKLKQTENFTRKTPEEMLAKANEVNNT